MVGKRIVARWWAIISLSVLLSLSATTSVVAAGTATVTISLKTNTGAAVAGQSVTCTIIAPQSGPYPPKPQFTYIKADASGNVTWQPTLIDGATYKCTPQTTLTPDSCFTWGGGNNSTGDMSLNDGDSRSFAFTAVPTGTCNSATAQQPTKTQQTAEQPSTPTATAELAVPQVTRVTLEGKEVKPGEKPTVTSGQHLVFIGKTVPDGTVVVTVHSDPISTKVIADGAGEWTFDIASLKKLPAGNHQVQVSALDTTTNKESAKNAVVSFKLLTAATTTKKKAVATTTSPKEDGSNPLVWALVGLATVVFLTGLIWWLLRRKKAQPANDHLKPAAQDDIGASDPSDPISRNDTLKTNDQTRPPMA